MMSTPLLLEFYVNRNYHINWKALADEQLVLMIAVGKSKEHYTVPVSKWFPQSRC